MRIIRTLIITAVLFTVCTAAKSSFNRSEGNLSKNYAINSYIKAIKSGKASDINKILDPQVKFTILQGTKAVSYLKNKLPEFLSANKIAGKKATTITVLKNKRDTSVVEINRSSNGLVNSNYVTLVHAGNGWKITSVYSAPK